MNTKPNQADAQMRQRKLIVASDIILCLFFGLTYTWSIFKKPLAAEFGWTDTQLTWTFTLNIISFCFGSFAGAFLGRKFRYTNLVRTSGLIIFAALLLASHTQTLWHMYLSFGIMLGTAIGISFNVLLATINIWFSDKPGIISGLLLMSIGGGGLILAPLITALIKSAGWRSTFLLLAFLYLIVFILASFQVRMPVKKYVEKLSKINHLKLNDDYPDITSRVMLKQKSFYSYFVWGTLLSSIGIALFGQLFTIAVSFGIDDFSASFIVGMTSIFNGLGRFIFSALFDIKGGRKTILIVTLVMLSGSIMLVYSLMFTSLWALYPAMALMGTAYGAMVPTNSNYTRSFYGVAHFSMNLSIVTLNQLFAVFIGQYIGSSLYVISGEYIITAVSMLIISLASIGFALLIKQT